MVVKKRKCIMVLGMHRSGTSAMAGLLQKIGLPLGTDLMQGNEFNPKGYFENLKIFELNEQILQELSIRWDSTYLLEEKAFNSYLGNSDNVDRIRNLIRNEFAEHDIFVIKDPRISILFAVWHRALVIEDIDPSIIIMLRHPAEVWESFLLRDHFDFAKSSLLWMHHHLCSEQVTRYLPRIFIHFDDLLVNPEEVLKSIIFQLKIEVPNLNIDGFLENNLKHYNRDNILNLDIPELTHLYNALIGLTRNPSEPAIMEKMDLLGQDFISRFRFYNQFNLSYDYQSTLFNQMNEKVLKLEQEKGELRQTLNHEIQQLNLLNERIDEQFRNLNQKYTIISEELKTTKESCEELNNALEKRDKKYEYDMNERVRELAEKNLQIAVRKYQLKSVDQDLSKIRTALQKSRKREKALEIEIDDVRRSLSFRIGWTLTRPFGVIYDRFVSTTVGKWAQVALRYPRSFLTIASYGNLKLLIKALQREDRQSVFRNFKTLMTRNSGGKLESPIVEHHL